jgi:mono/diheme cytochrome c family protein
MPANLNGPTAMRLPQYNLRCRALSLMAIPFLCAVAATALAEMPSGEQIYKDQCARCHGKSGEGTEDNYPDPLEGDKSVAQLTKLIHETMPDDADTKASAADSEKVAAYIYDTFYSPEARVRNKPARIELSRLTVRQYQNAITDLVGSFRPTAEWGTQRGLRGEYNQSRNIGGDPKKHFERVDPQVDFDFAQSSPDPKQLDPTEFSIRWQGSILAPDTGEYEFVVRTPHSVRLFVNDIERPLIDDWVKSGNDTEHRGTIRLLGGRPYPIKLEYAKAEATPKPKPKPKKKDKENDKSNDISKEKSDDKAKDKNKVADKNQDKTDKDKSANKDKGKEKPKEEDQPQIPLTKSFISLAWKRPNHTVEVIPARCLSVNVQPELFVSHTRFPPDDRSVGYERGTSISKAWDEATTDSAIEVAAYVTTHLEKLSGVNPDGADSVNRLRAFCSQFAERAFRRPLASELKALYIDRQLAKGGDAIAGVKRVVLLILKSPRFLYREFSGKPTDQFDTASRISFGLWDSLPDEQLTSAAKTGKLATNDEIAAQLQRMLPDLRTRSKLREFFLGWLKISQPRDLSKDPKVFPEFTPDVISDLRTSLELSLDDVLNSGSADFREFLLTDDMYFNGRLAKLYGPKLPENAPFQKVDFEPDHRAGVLSHPYLLASLAYTSSSSPIHRGVFLSRNVLGRVLRPPAQAVAPLPPELHADLSNRERVALQTQPETCQGCHAMINPLGFTMENFDAIGRYHESDKNKPIDATGSYLTQTGEVKKFKGEKDLAKFLAASEESQDAFVKQLFHHTVKQPIRAYGPNTLKDLQKQFAKNNYNIQKLLIDIVAASATPK